VTYAGTNFEITYEMVNNPGFSYSTAGLTLYLNGTAAGTAPIVYTWDFGDGTQGTGQSVNHTYGAADTYTVVMTATNVWGFGEAMTYQLVDISGPSGWWAYLPIVARGHAGR
jgi:PKD repeat protein